MNATAAGSTLRQALTLIEVLVVVAIIALLLAILVPVLSRARDQGRSVACRSNVNQLMKGMSGYIAEQNGFPGTHSLFFYHMNTSFPEGNFNGLDRIATRHMPTADSKGGQPGGRASIAFLDGHVESRTYPAKTRGCELFAEYGQPHVWHDSGPPDTVNAAAFIRKLPGRCPW